MSAAASSSASSTAAASSSTSSLPPLSSTPYLLQQYCHDDPKKLNDFRLPELDALCHLYSIPRCYSPEDVLYSSPFLRMRFPDPCEKYIDLLARRAILATRWTELWSSGKTVEECLAQFKQAEVRDQERVRKYTQNVEMIYDVRVHTFGQTPTQTELAELREKVITSVEMKGKLLSGSNIVGAKLFLFIDIGSPVVNPSRVIRGVYLVREMYDDRFLTLENDYRLNARTFIGPTSMPANLSFIMSNLALVKKNSIVYDPFVGTGSLLVSAGHFGAICIGSDLDWKILHGHTKKGPITVRDNFKQYKLTQPELLCSDHSLNMWKCAATGKGFVDAIICDPPYGVRAGARKSGRAEGKEVRTVDNSNAHIPTTQIYDVEDVIHDLLDQSAQLLKINGRLIYWLPTTTEFRNSELPSHPCMRQVSVSEQLVRSHFSRRLITMEKILDFTEERRMYRRSKLTEPPPKYANLKESLLAMADEAPTSTIAAIAASASGATAMDTSDNVAAAASSSIPARPLSQAALKRIAKLEEFHARKLREAEEHGGKRPSRKARALARAEKGRIPIEEYKELQKQKHLELNGGQKRKKQQEEKTQETDAQQTTTDGSSAQPASSSSVASVPAAASSSSSSSVISPPSPPITQPMKKTRVEEDEPSKTTL